MSVVKLAAFAVAFAGLVIAASAMASLLGAAGVKAVKGKFKGCCGPDKHHHHHGHGHGHHGHHHDHGPCGDKREGARDADWGPKGADGAK